MCSCVYSCVLRVAKMERPGRSDVFFLEHAQACFVPSLNSLMMVMQMGVRAVLEVKSTFPPLRIEPASPPPQHQSLHRFRQWRGGDRGQGSFGNQ